MLNGSSLRPALVFTSPGGGNRVPVGTRTVLSGEYLDRADHAVLTRATGPTVGLAYTPRRVQRALTEADPASPRLATARMGALSADVWFAHSEDRGRSWRQAHVAGPTDLRTAPLPGHNFVGEYQGLAGMPRGRGFAAVFTLAAPQAKDGPTDIFFARIGPGR
jgi:hypothetical protein